MRIAKLDPEEMAEITRQARKDIAARAGSSQRRKRTGCSGAHCGAAPLQAGPVHEKPNRRKDNQGNDGRELSRRPLGRAEDPRQARRQDPPTATAAANAPPYPTALKTIFGRKPDNVRKTCLPIGDIPQRESPMEQVLSKKQVCEQANISNRTLDRENAAGRGPVRTQLGLRRWASPFQLRRLAGQPPKSPARLGRCARPTRVACALRGRPPDRTAAESGAPTSVELSPRTRTLRR